jgi:GNAT superfamily N-acetyltransferase
MTDIAGDGLLFRIATRDDVPALHPLIEASVRELQAHDYSPAQIDGALGTWLGVDTQLIADQTYFVAETPDRRELAACGGWSRRKTPYGSDHRPNREDTLLDPLKEAAKIRAFFVHPRWARRGIGTKLLEMCEAAARAEGVSSFEMGATLTGIPLYQRYGYIETGRIDLPLADGGVLPIAKMVKRDPI